MFFKLIIFIQVKKASISDFDFFCFVAKLFLMSKSKNDEWYGGMLNQITSRFEGLLKEPTENISQPIIIDNQKFQVLKPFLIENIFPILGVAFPNVPGVEILQAQVALDFSLWLGKKRPDILSETIKMLSL